MKQRWYRSNITKAVLIVLEHVFAVTAVVSVLWMLAYPAAKDELFEGSPAKEYENSRNFETQMHHYASQVAAGIGTKDLFETDGRYDPDKLVDIQEYRDHSTISGKNTSGLCYRLGDLLAWSADGIYDDEKETEDAVIVCKKPDGTYHYYKSKDFAKEIEAGNLKFVTSGETDRTSGAILDDLLHDTYPEEMGEAEFKGLQNGDGEMVYINCWNFDGFIMKEKAKPEGADSIIDIANEDPNWNGRLNDAFDMLSNVIYTLEEMHGQYEYMHENLAEGDTNFTYIYADTKTGQVFTNRKAYESFADLDLNLEEMCEMGKYVIVLPKLADFKTNLKDMDASAWRNTIRDNSGNARDFVFAAAVDTTYPIQDSFHTENRLYSKYAASARTIAAFGAFSVLLFVIGFVWLIWIAGRRTEDEELHLSRFDYWKTEIAALLVIGIWLAPTMLGIYGIGSMSVAPDMSEQYYTQASYVSNSIPYIIVGAVMAAYTCGMFLIGALSLTRRVKARTLWKDSVLRSLIRFVRQIFDNLHCIWKTIVLFGTFVVVHWFAYITYSSAMTLMVMFAVEIAAFVYLIRSAIGRDKLKKGIQKISAGDVEYKIPLQGLDSEQRIIAEDINSVGEGLDAALAKSMKSERLKTDLITNVSHDIKTPLTSIINYVNLLKQENIDDPKIQHYIEVLEQKAQRLKTLTEDVVEASKVSSGNITLEYMNINLVEMIQQTSGEFEEKFAARDLQEMMSLPEEEALIRADGRRTWRILENIYNNAAKYAMKGSRVYADLRVGDKDVIFSLKNVSEQPLNISADELTERFIRGDVSRSTEGSGLGLSIAKTLTEMQGGKFELYLDGDLFKVTITFPKVDNTCGLCG